MSNAIDRENSELFPSVQKLALRRGKSGRGRRDGGRGRQGGAGNVPIPLQLVGKVGVLHPLLPAPLPADDRGAGAVDTPIRRGGIQPQRGEIVEELETLRPAARVERFLAGKEQQEKLAKSDEFLTSWRCLPCLEGLCGVRLGTWRHLSLRSSRG